MTSSLLLCSSRCERKFALAQTREMPGPPLLRRRRDTSCCGTGRRNHAWMPRAMTMDKPAPPDTMGPVKKNPDPSAASMPDMGDARQHDRDHRPGAQTHRK